MLKLTGDMRNTILCLLMPLCNFVVPDPGGVYLQEGCADLALAVRKADANEGARLAFTSYVARAQAVS